MTREDSAISNRLRAARERLGWSREELAVHAGLSWSAISQVESGRRRNLRPQTLARLADALGVSIDYLVHGGSTAPMLTHRALLYEGPDEFADGTGRFLLEGVERSEAALAVTGKENLKRLRKWLGGAADHVELVDSAGRLTSPEAAIEFFRQFLTDRLREGAVWVRVVGEPVWKGRSRTEVRLWTRHESLVNLLFGSSPMSMLCPYDVGAVDPAILSEAQMTHPETIRGGETIESPDYRDPGSFLLEG